MKIKGKSSNHRVYVEAICVREIWVTDSCRDG